MKKTYTIENFDCPNCAARAEKLVNKIDGVKEASISFVAKKLTVETELENIEELMEKVIAACKKVEPDCVIR